MEMRRAFTLIELLVVVALVAILIALIVPGLQGARARARDAACLADLRSGLTGIVAAWHRGEPWPALDPVRCGEAQRRGLLGYWVMDIAGEPGSPPRTLDGYLASVDLLNLPVCGDTYPVHGHQNLGYFDGRVACGR